MNDNGFSGRIAPLASLVNLQYVDLSDNEMTGSLIYASNLTKLETLKANSNKFSGPIPRSFSGISDLGMFNLVSNTPYHVTFLNTTL